MGVLLLSCAMLRLQSNRDLLALLGAQVGSPNNRKKKMSTKPLNKKITILKQARENRENRKQTTEQMSFITRTK